ncbi:hypothetical protein ACFQX6_67610 [Streptosporangium lutulentum]
MIPTGSILLGRNNSKFLDSKMRYPDPDTDVWLRIVEQDGRTVADAIVPSCLHCRKCGDIMLEVGNILQAYGEERTFSGELKAVGETQEEDGTWTIVIVNGRAIQTGIDQEPMPITPTPEPRL